MGGWYRRHITNAQEFEDPYNYVPGYFCLDATANYKLNTYLDVFATVKNITNAIYGGIDATGTDIDLRYNPQMKRNFRFGVNISLN